MAKVSTRDLQDNKVGTSEVRLEGKRIQAEPFLTSLYLVIRISRSAKRYPARIILRSAHGAGLTRRGFWVDEAHS